MRGRSMLCHHLSTQQLTPHHAPSQGEPGFIPGGKCGRAIPFGEVRFGSSSENMEGRFFWRCLQCVTKAQLDNAAETYCVPPGSLVTENIPGFCDLTNIQQKTVLETFGQFGHLYGDADTVVTAPATPVKKESKPASKKPAVVSAPSTPAKEQDWIGCDDCDAWHAVTKEDVS